MFTGDGQNNPSNVWQADANTPGTPTEVKTNGTVSCLMGGQLFWFTYAQTGNGISSCTVSNCSATTKPIVTLAAGAFFRTSLGCDAVNNELVWASGPDGASFTISRASVTGSNLRPITSFTFADNSWQLDNGGQFLGDSDWLFYSRLDLSSNTDYRYYISTSSVNAAGVQIAKLQKVGLGPAMTSPPIDLSNSSTFLVSEYSSATNTYSILSIPLPNGIISGAPPTFSDGYISGGVLDDTGFFGTIWSSATIPEDAIVRCPPSGCSAPIIMTRGQTMPSNFATDGSAIYWTTNGQASNIAIWKIAK